jgi:hypothetical protein
VCEPVTRSPSLSGWAGGGVGRRDLNNYLGNNYLTGTIPTNVGLLTSLTYLYASYRPPPCVSR